jgi:hypothetical protein
MSIRWAIAWDELLQLTVEAALVAFGDGWPSRAVIGLCSLSLSAREGTRPLGLVVRHDTPRSERVQARRRDNQGEKPEHANMAGATDDGEFFLSLQLRLHRSLHYALGRPVCQQPAGTCRCCGAPWATSLLLLRLPQAHRAPPPSHCRRRQTCLYV